MIIFDTTLVTDAPADELWRVWTDVGRWAEWDPHEEEARLDGPFEAGATGHAKQVGAPGGPFTLFEVAPGRRFVSGSDSRGGRIRGTHEITPLGDGRVRLRADFVGTGLLGLVIKVGWGQRLLADSRRTLEALARRAGGAVVDV